MLFACQLEFRENWKGLLILGKTSGEECPSAVIASVARGRDVFFTQPRPYEIPRSHVATRAGRLVPLRHCAAASRNASLSLADVAVLAVVLCHFLRPITRTMYR